MGIRLSVGAPEVVGSPGGPDADWENVSAAQMLDDVFVQTRAGALFAMADPDLVRSVTPAERAGERGARDAARYVRVFVDDAVLAAAAPPAGGVVPAGEVAWSSPLPLLVRGSPAHAALLLRARVMRRAALAMMRLGAAEEAPQGGVGLRCLAGHALVMTAVAERANAYDCDLCTSGCALRTPRWHCDIDDFDVCAGCATRAAGLGGRRGGAAASPGVPGPPVDGFVAAAACLLALFSRLGEQAPDACLPMVLSAADVLRAIPDGGLAHVPEFAGRILDDLGAAAREAVVRGGTVGGAAAALAIVLAVRRRHLREALLTASALVESPAGTIVPAAALEGVLRGGDGASVAVGASCEDVARSLLVFVESDGTGRAAAAAAITPAASDRSGRRVSTAAMPSASASAVSGSDGDNTNHDGAKVRWSFDDTHSLSYRVYCGRTVGQSGYVARCAICDGKCGPGRGCQCQACAAFTTAMTSASERNFDGVVVHRSRRAMHGEAGVRHYCGRHVGSNGYRVPCGSCDGRCGPNSGCQCKACAALDDALAGKIVAAGSEPSESASVYFGGGAADVSIGACLSLVDSAVRFSRESRRADVAVEALRVLRRVLSTLVTCNLPLTQGTRASEAGVCDGGRVLATLGGLASDVAVSDRGGPEQVVATEAVHTLLAALDRATSNGAASSAQFVRGVVAGGCGAGDSTSRKLLLGILRVMSSGRGIRSLLRGTRRRDNAEQDSESKLPPCSLAESKDGLDNCGAAAHEELHGLVTSLFEMVAVNLSSVVGGGCRSGATGDSELREAAVSLLDGVMRGLLVLNSSSGAASHSSSGAASQLLLQMLTGKVRDTCSSMIGAACMSLAGGESLRDVDRALYESPVSTLLPFLADALVMLGHSFPKIFVECVGGDDPRLFGSLLSDFAWCVARLYAGAQASASHQLCGCTVTRANSRP